MTTNVDVFEYNVGAYRNHHLVTVPLDKVCEGGISLTREVRKWLYDNVGDNRGRVEVVCWDFVAGSVDKNYAQFAFLDQQQAALFRLFWS